MSKIKMIVTDLDNTLFTDSKEVSEYTLATIHACMEKGIKFVPATARALRVLERFNFPNLISYDALICLNGSMIYLEHKLVYHEGISQEELSEFLPVLLEKYGDQRISIEIGGIFYANHNVSEVDPYDKDYIVCDLQDIPDKTTKIDRIIMSLENPDNITEIQAILPNFLYAHTVSDSPICRILHKNVTKANAIKQLCEQWSISPGEIVAFGDDQNDMEMFELCGTTVAMDNAIPELKSIATHITESNEEDGVAHWLTKNIL